MSAGTPKITLRRGNQVLDENPEIEWYSGGELYTHPVRINVSGIWEDVLQYEKITRENTKQQREIVFRCRISEDYIIEAVINQGS